MPYIALKTFDGPGGTKRRPGEVVPEASSWKNPQPWVNSGHVRFVSDAEIKGGRWMHYETYAGAGAVRAPPSPEPKPTKAPEPEPELDVGHEEPEHMEPESTPSAKRGSKKGKHRG